MARITMSLEDELARLVEVATAARGRYIALGLSNVTMSADLAEGPTAEKLAEVAAAEAACQVADDAVADLRAKQRWTTTRV